MSTAALRKRDVKWFKLFFHLCKIVNTAPDQGDFDYALEVCKQKECISMIREQYEQFYPQA